MCCKTMTVIKYTSVVSCISVMLNVGTVSNQINVCRVVVDPSQYLLYVLYVAADSDNFNFGTRTMKRTVRVTV